MGSDTNQANVFFKHHLSKENNYQKLQLWNMQSTNHPIKTSAHRHTVGLSLRKEIPCNLELWCPGENRGSGDAFEYLGQKGAQSHSITKHVFHRLLKHMGKTRCLTHSKVHGASHRVRLRSSFPPQSSPPRYNTELITLMSTVIAQHQACMQYNMLIKMCLYMLIMYK